MTQAKDNLLFTNTISDDLADQLREESFTKFFVLVDENTKQHCLPIILESFPVKHQAIIINQGERNKTLDTCQTIWQSLTNTNADRHALLINLGGGVICDMGGFCARIYKRGIKFWNIPTTLLSQVDASVGGKLGVDFGVYKNHLGLFSEPDKVIVDSVFLASLPQDEIISGYAEIIKHALISDRKMFNELIDQNIENINWTSWVPRSVAIKKSIVDHDPFEKGLRKVLNFGHTIGHAIESHYLGTGVALKHGEAIAIGMLTETNISVEKNLLPKEEGELIITFLLDTFPKIRIDDSAIDRITKITLQDKKNKNGSIKAVLLSTIGKAVFDVEISENEIKKSLVYYNRLIK